MTRPHWFTSLLSSALAVHAIVRAEQGPALLPDPNRVIRDSRGGGGEAFQITSSILKQTRRINVAVPPSFAQTSSERRYPVTVVVDGEAHLAPVAAVSEELTRHGLIPEAIIVAIENADPFRGRVHDLTPPGLSVSGSSLNEGGDLFLDFIEKELLPAVDRQFRGGPPRTFVGHSSGGILATYAAATRPAFRAVVVIDAPVQLGENWLPKRLIARAAMDPTPLRFAYFQVRFPWPDLEWDAMVAAAPATWNLYKEQFEREGHETAFMLGAYLGLREVFGDYSRLAAPQAPTTRILPYYATVSETFGAALIPPERILHDVVENFLMEGRGAAARDAYNKLVAGYGVPTDSATLMKQITEVEQQPPPTETVEDLLATPPPTPEEARAYIGEWVGEVRVGPERRVREGPLTLRITVIDGRVVAELESATAPEEFRIRRPEYLKVTPVGLSWGFMNGMRPYGVRLYEASLEGDRLAGKARWGGIMFKRPEGMPPDDETVSFTRVCH